MNEMIERVARALCVLDGHDPDAIGDPPNTVGAIRQDHAFPRWLLWSKPARAAIAVALEEFEEFATFLDKERPSAAQNMVSSSDSFNAGVIRGLEWSAEQARKFTTALK